MEVINLTTQPFPHLLTYHCKVVTTAVRELVDNWCNKRIRTGQTQGRKYTKLKYPDGRKHEIKVEN